MTLTHNIINVTSAIGELFFPPICSACGTHLFKHEVEICQMCMRRLPRTYFEKRPHDNMISAMMWGRCRIEYAYSLFYYKKGERVQQLLHDIKYRGNKKLGIELGRQIGKMIIQSDRLQFDEIIPIPLHPQKEKKRGFNQAEIIAKGIAEALMIPINIHNVYRNTHTSSQTRKGRFARWQNVQDIFSVRNVDQLRNKHILMVDDVITTGSTLEACINQISTIEGTKISVATIACASL